jgi:MerR family transcriptional regulator, copper efflux regulator
MEALTINEAARTTGWSPRMLRYIERAGLLELRRSAGGYRLYGPAQLQRLRTLRELMARFDFGLSELGFARRLRGEARLAAAVEEWFQTEPERPDFIAENDWLRWEQEKHQALLAAAETPQMEAA